MVLLYLFLFQVCERFSQGAYFPVVAFSRSSEMSSIATQFQVRKLPSTLQVFWKTPSSSSRVQLPSQFTGLVL